MDKILVKYIVKREPRAKDSPRYTKPPLIVFFPGEHVNFGMISYLGASFTTDLDEEFKLPATLCNGEAAFDYYLECKTVKLSQEQQEAIEARVLMAWPPADRGGIELRRAHKVTGEDRSQMWKC